MSTKKVVYVALALVMMVNLLAVGVVSAAPPQQEEATYTVKLGDNLWTLAEKYLGSGPAYSAIVAATNAKNAEWRGSSSIRHRTALLRGTNIRNA